MMITHFFEGVVEGLSERTLKYLFNPAFIFWSAGIIFFTYRFGFTNAWSWWQNLKLTEQVMLIFFAVMLISLSSAIIHHFRFHILRLIEGYWPRPFEYFSRTLSDRKARKWSRWIEDWNRLIQKREKEKLTPDETRRLAQLEILLHHHPVRSEDFLPTTVGNTLRAMETSVYHRFGLVAVAVWPTLWLILPDTVKKEISAARNQMNTWVENLVWGILFLIWSAFWPWACIFAILWITLAYRLIIFATRTFADLLLATFALYRFNLYDALGLKKPSNSLTERIQGEELSEYLWRGTTKKPLNFIDQ